MVDETFTVEVRVRTEQGIRAFDQLGAAVTKFRDNIAGVNTAFNRTVNFFAVIFRRLARLRTAFFILVTFLAVRPFIRFFRDAIEGSALAQARLQDLTDEFDRFKRNVGTALAPIVEFFGKKLLDFLDDILNFLNQYSGIIGFILDALEKLFKKVGLLIRLLFNMQIAIIRNVKTGVNAVIDFFAFVVAVVRDLVFDSIEFITREIRLMLTKIIAALEGAKAAGFKIPGLDETLVGLKVVRDQIKGIENEYTNAVRIAELASDKFSEALLNNVGGVLDALGDSKQAFLDLFKTIQPQLGSLFKQFIRHIIELEKQSKITSEFVQGLLDGLNKSIQKTSEIISKFVRDVIKTFETSLADVLVAIFRGAFEDIRDLLRDFLTKLQQDLANVAAASIRNFIVQLVKKAVVAIAGAGAGAGVGGAAGGIGEGVGVGNSTSGAAQGPPTFGRLGGTNTGVAIQPTSTVAGVHVNLNIQALDGPSVVKVLNDNKGAINDIVAGGISGQSTRLRGALQTQLRTTA